jgi:hypothetical protein
VRLFTFDRRLGIVVTRVCDREEFVRRLMKVISVDSYGSCLHNRDVRDLLGADHALVSEPWPGAKQKLEVMSRCMPRV